MGHDPLTLNIHSHRACTLVGRGPPAASLQAGVLTAGGETLAGPSGDSGRSASRMAGPRQDSVGEKSLSLVAPQWESFLVDERRSHHKRKRPQTVIPAGPIAQGQVHLGASELRSCASLPQVNGSQNSNVTPHAAQSLSNAFCRFTRHSVPGLLDGEDFSLEGRGTSHTK